MGDVAPAARLVGAPGGGTTGTGVVAQAVLEKADAWPLAPTARTRKQCSVPSARPVLLYPVTSAATEVSLVNVPPAPSVELQISNAASLSEASSQERSTWPNVPAAASCDGAAGGPDWWQMGAVNADGVVPTGPTARTR